jgi:TnpA family transposase
MNAGEHGASYKDLLYVRRRFITKDHMRDAVMRVVNAIFCVRHPHIWGEGTTACRLGLEKVWCLGSKPHDGVARALRRARRDDLLAR